MHLKILSAKWRPFCPGGVELYRAHPKNYANGWHFALFSSLKAKDRQFDNFVMTGGIVSCRNNNLRCHQSRQSCQIDDQLFSVLWSGTNSCYPYPSGLLHKHWGNHMIVQVLVEQPWRIWVNMSYQPQYNQANTTVYIFFYIMMMSSNGNIFRVTGPFLVQGIYWSPKGQWRGALMFHLIYAWTNAWANNRDAGDMRRQCAHHDVTVMIL